MAGGLPLGDSRTQAPSIWWLHHPTGLPGPAGPLGQPMGQDRMWRVTAAVFMSHAWNQCTSLPLGKPRSRMLRNLPEVASVTSAGARTQAAVVGLQRAALYRCSYHDVPQRSAQRDGWSFK